MGAPVELIRVLAANLAVEIKHNERDSEQRLKNFLENAQRETVNIKTVSLLGFSQLL
jgi:hypothetical protein